MVVGCRPTHCTEAGDQSGLDLGFDAFIEDAVRLGFARETAKNVTRWVVGRIALHRGGVRVDHITATDVDELGEAMQAFAQRSDVSDPVWLSQGLSATPPRAHPVYTPGAAHALSSRAD